ncbi:MAG: GNAT family N-acetyltransferase [Planctomycetes bacterium]|nr:GNAT family N-acetyltransferase [Planctomycetota bacterium]
MPASAISLPASPRQPLPLDAATERAWHAAARRTPQLDPFCCRSEWQLAFHEVFAPERSLLFAGDDDSCVVFARVPLRTGTLLAPIDTSWQFGCPLLGPAALDVLDLQLRYGSGSATTNLLISALEPDGPLLRDLHARFDETHRFSLAHTDTSCRASLEGGLDGYLARRSPRTRRNVRAAARRAAALGVTFERVAPADAATANATYQRMLLVERRSWKGIGRCGMTMPPSRQFYAALLERMAASGAARVMFARRGDADIGFVFGGVADGVYRGQQFSYDEHWSPFSIGNLLQLEQLRWLCEEGAARYDMGPMMDYKRHWTEQWTAGQSWLLQPR